MKARTIGLLLASLCISMPAFAQQKPGAIAPAEKLAEGWEEIDQRLIFLMVRLANVEASLDAVDKVIGKSTGKRTSNLSAAKRAEAGNDLMDRKAGGPMKWSEFYGTTAEKFFYHPTDRNTTYHTRTVLSQQGPRADNKVGGGVPAGQGLPVHQRPPQFDYIYRANANAKERADADAAELKGKIEALIERRQRLEVEQAGLWCEVAFRAVSHYDLDKKPLYRFEPLLVAGDSESRQHAETMKAAASFMALALSIIDEAQKDQATTFSKIKPAVSDARLKLNDSLLRLAVDVTDRKAPEGRFAALAKRLDDVASNLSDSYVVANEGDQAKDQQRKDTFRALLQESLVNYAQIILALDEMAALMKEEWKIKPDVDRPIQAVSLMTFQSVPVTRPFESTPLVISPTTKSERITASIPAPLLALTFDSQVPIENHGAKSVQGKVGKALQFDGKSYVSVAGEFPSGTMPRTLAVWLKNTRGPVRRNIHIVNYGPWSQTKVFGIMEAGGKWHFFDWSGGLNSGMAVDQNWHHHCLTYDGRKLIYYLDGNEASNAERTLATNAKPLILGTIAPNANEYGYVGLIDELAIYDKALDADEIRQLRQLGMQGKHPYPKKREGDSISG